MSAPVHKNKIVLYPDPVLRIKAHAVDRIEESTRALVARMFELMREAEGVGLAAPQVGVSLRIFVANATGQPEDDRVFINPVLREPAQEIAVREEGCLSLPNIRADIRRPKSITLDATDLDGKKFTLTSDDLPARIWQHENDHLDGVLILDRMSPLDKLANRRKIKDLEGR